MRPWRCIAASRAKGAPPGTLFLFWHDDDWIRSTFMQERNAWLRHQQERWLQEDGSWISPRESLKDEDFETRWQYGIDVLRRYGVLK